MNAFILSLVTRHPLTVPVTGFSKEKSWNMAAFCRVVYTFWHPYICQDTRWFYGVFSGGLSIKVCASVRGCVCVCASSGQKVVISLNARPNGSVLSCFESVQLTHTHTSSSPAPITALHLLEKQKCKLTTRTVVQDAHTLVYYVCVCINPKHTKRT